MAARTKSKVSPKYKTKYHVRNWPKYDRALAKPAGPGRKHLLPLQARVRGCSSRHRLRFAETRSAHRLQRLEPDGRAGDAGVLLDQLIGDECGRFSPRSRFMHQRRATTPSWSTTVDRGSLPGVGVVEKWDVSLSLFREYVWLGLAENRGDEIRNHADTRRRYRHRGE